MSKLTFKQFLLELMVDVDPEATATQQLTNVRQKQMMAKKDPQRVRREEIDKAKQQKAAANVSTEPTAGLEKQIASKKEELFRMQERLAQMKKSQPAAPAA